MELLPYKDNMLVIKFGQVKYVFSNYTGMSKKAVGREFICMPRFWQTGHYVSGLAVGPSICLDKQMWFRGSYSFIKDIIIVELVTEWNQLILVWVVLGIYIYIVAQAHTPSFFFFFVS